MTQFIVNEKTIFFKIDASNQTNGKSPEINKNWCSCPETHGGDVQKQYGDGNSAEVWFKTGNIYLSDEAISNEGYFTKKDSLIFQPLST
tara:strand:+ start:140 stop:406 length:267 start_codon:yes stop_codon:yes gene_type:complete